MLQKWFNHLFADSKPLLGFSTLTLVVLAFAPPSVHAQGVILPLPPEDQQMITAQLGPGVVGNALPSSPIGDASTYFPLQERAPTYQVTAGRNAGNTQTLGLIKAHRPNGNVAWRFQMSPIAGGLYPSELRRAIS